eukprot:sb/3477741/
MSVDVTKLSDKELKEKLTDLGHGSGRITATTRQVYENLLEKLMGAAVATDKIEEPKTPPPTTKTPPAALSTPTTRGALKRSAEENQTVSEETFSVPSDKKKKGERD